MSLVKRVLITLAAMLVASFLFGLLWSGLFNANMPSYLSGAIGGIAALVTWEYLRPAGRSKK